MAETMSALTLCSYCSALNTAILLSRLLHVTHARRHHCAKPLPQSGELYATALSSCLLTLNMLIVC